MPRRSTVRAMTTIGIDMGKNTLHMIGLDSCGAIVLREKGFLTLIQCRDRPARPQAELACSPIRLRLT
jgi:hypothetical protein